MGIWPVAKGENLEQRAHSRRQNLSWVLIVVFLAAFVLRLAAIDRQSIWYDEGLSIYHARGSVGEVLRQASQSDHPPLHTLALHVWMMLAGDSELSVRMLSTCWGVLAVALFYRLGRRIEPAVGALGALLLALSPWAVWYSQETRGYMMALALTIGTVDVALDLYAGTRSGWRYVVYVLLGTAALYTHFYSGFVLLALNLAYLLLAPTMVRTRAGRVQGVYWLIAQAAVGLLFAPWVPFVTNQLDLNATYWHGAVGWRQIVRRTLVAFSVGQTLTDDWATVATWVVSLLALAGAIYLLRRRDWRRHLLVDGWWMLVPTLILITLNQTRPKFSPRYLMNAWPPFLLLAAAGARWLGLLVRRHLPAWRGWLATVILVCAVLAWGNATVHSLSNLYWQESFYRPDFRGVARYIDEHAGANDLIVLVGGHSYPAFRYYYRGPLPILPLPGELLPTTQRPIDLRTLETLNEAIAGRQTLWLVLWQEWLADPTGLVMDEIEQTYHRLGVGGGFHDIALLAFDVRPGPLLSERIGPQVPTDTELGGQMRFLGYDLPVDTARPGETLYLYLYWEAAVPLRDDYKVFTQIVDSNGRIVAQQDKFAGADAYPTSHWPAEAMVRDRFLLTVYPDTPSGRYRLIAGLYNPGPGLPRLPVSGDRAFGDYILIAPVRIE